MRKTLLILFTLQLFIQIQAQESTWIYATIDNSNALLLQNDFPEEVQILESSDLISAVYLSQEAAMALKNYGNLHGPGFIFRKNQQEALNSLNFIQESSTNVLDFTITEDLFVQQCIAMVNEENIGNTIVELENYNTRFHTKATGVQASLDIKTKWENMVIEAERTDISVEAFEHGFTDQISVILTIPGSESPDEIVIIGGHLDSGDYWIQNFAPGADDNASGIAVLTETLRILLENGFYPKKTVQIMGYAAEEVGLYGSSDIASTYNSDNKNVLAVMQLDMTNYNGSDFDIALISDAAYTSSELNLFLIELLEHYNSVGEHSISYDYSYCGYACSDHVSWTENGYLASFPFESAFGEDNPNIHTTNDTYAAMGSTAEHSVKFVKLALEFVIEIAKTHTMGIQEVSPGSLAIAVQNKNLIYDLSELNSQLKSVVIYDVNARQLLQKTNLDKRGSISLQGFTNGVYIAVFKDINGKSYTKKFLIQPN